MEATAHVVDGRRVPLEALAQGRRRRDPVHALDAREVVAAARLEPLARELLGDLAHGRAPASARARERAGAAEVDALDVIRREVLTTAAASRARGMGLRRKSPCRHRRAQQGQPQGITAVTDATLRALRRRRLKRRPTVGSAARARPPALLSSVQRGHAHGAGSSSAGAAAPDAARQRQRGLLGVVERERDPAVEVLVRLGLALDRNLLGVVERERPRGRGPRPARTRSRPQSPHGWRRAASARAPRRVRRWAAVVRLRAARERWRGPGRHPLAPPFEQFQIFDIFCSRQPRTGRNRASWVVVRTHRPWSGCRACTRPS